MQERKEDVNRKIEDTEKESALTYPEKTNVWLDIKHQYEREVSKEQEPDKVLEENRMGGNIAVFEKTEKTSSQVNSKDTYPVEKNAINAPSVVSDSDSDAGENSNNRKRLELTGNRDALKQRLFSEKPEKNRPGDDFGLNKDR